MNAEYRWECIRAELTANAFSIAQSCEPILVRSRAGDCQILYNSLAWPTTAACNQKASSIPAKMHVTII